MWSGVTESLARVHIYVASPVAMLARAHDSSLHILWPDVWHAAFFKDRKRKGKYIAWVSFSRNAHCSEILLLPKKNIYFLCPKVFQSYVLVIISLAHLQKIIHQPRRALQARQ